MIVTLSASEYADMLRTFDCVQAPVAIAGYVYAVKKGNEDCNIYRTAVT